MAEQDADNIIRQSIITGEMPTSGDVERIIERIRSATFSMSRRNIPPALRTLMQAHGYSVTDHGNDLLYHWAKHVLRNQQWPVDTTPTDYFGDAIAAARHPNSRLIVQPALAGQPIATVIATTRDVGPAERMGPRSGPELLVIYSADAGRILSAYMVATSSLYTVRPGTVWLRR